MARTLTSQETSALASRSATYWVRAIVNDGSTNRNLEALRSADDNWILSLSYQDSVDAQMATATLTCKLKEGYYNLAPLDTDSPINASPNATLLALGNTIKIYTATVPMGAKPASGDWNFVFDGYIEEVVVTDAETIQIMCHDLTEDLTTAYVQEVRTYGGGTKAFDDVCNDLLSDWASGTVTVVGAAITAIVKEYEQRVEPVYSALRILADQIGYAIRFVFDSGTSTFKLKLFSPDRTAAGGVDWTFSQDDWMAISVATSRKDVRNTVQVTYRNKGTAEARETVTVTNAASETAYGERWMRIAEGDSSQIDTSTEATALANACLDDLKEPTGYFSAKIPYHYAVEIRDYVTLTGDSIHFSADQSVAVDAVSHSVTNGGIGTTSLSLSGKPKLGTAAWKRKQAQYSYQQIARRNLDWTAGIGVNLCANGNFDEGDF